MWLLLLSNIIFLYKKLLDSSELLVNYFINEMIIKYLRKYSYIFCERMGYRF